MFSCEIREIFKNKFFYRTPLVAASDICGVPGCASVFIVLICTMFRFGMGNYRLTKTVAMETPMVSNYAYLIWIICKTESLISFTRKQANRNYSGYFYHSHKKLECSIYILMTMVFTTVSRLGM